MKVRARKGCEQASVNHYRGEVQEVGSRRGKQMEENIWLWEK